MRSLALLLLLSVAACAIERDRQLETTWNDATVLVASFDRSLPLHTFFPLVRLNVQIDNPTADTVGFYLGGVNFADGLIAGGEREDPGQFLLIGPDTTLALYAKRSRFEIDSLTVAPGGSGEVLLATDNTWIGLRQSDPSFVAMDSTSVARFFTESLDRGRLVYVTHGASPDTLVFARAPGATISVLSSDPTAQ